MRLALVLILLALTACATEIYKPAASSTGVGWREQQIETGRYRITFTGAASTDVGTVQDLALLRAAELTLSKGATWFTVVSSDVVEQEINRGGSAMISRSWTHYGGWLLIERDDERNRMVATLEIVLGKGPKPEGDPRAYDAQDVVNTIRPRLQPPV